MYEELQAKVCAITGAARSIGLGIAEAFCNEGAKVALVDIDGGQVADQAKRLAKGGFTAKGYQADVADHARVMDCFGQIQSDLGQVSILINNAGIVSQGPLEQISSEQIDRMMRVNAHGTLYCVQAVIAGMKKNRWGRIMNFSSKSGKTGSALMADYSAAKGAIIAMTHAMAFELAEHNITVNCLCPGITDQIGAWEHVSAGYVKNLGLSREEMIKKFTAKIPLGRLTQIEDIVNFALFLAAKGGYCTGQAFNITGGREVH